MAKRENPTTEKEPIQISKEVMAKFNEEYARNGRDLYRMACTFMAMKKRGENFVVMRYEGYDIGKYQAMLEKHGLADPDLFYDFSVPLNYFYMLLNRSKT